MVPEREETVVVVVPPLPRCVYRGQQRVACRDVEEVDHIRELDPVGPRQSPGDEGFGVLMCMSTVLEDEDRSRAVVGREQLRKLLPERNLEPGMAPVLRTDGLQNATATEVTPS